MTTSSSSSVEFDDDDVLRVATLLDRVAAELSPYRRFSLAKELLLPADLASIFHRSSLPGVCLT